MRMTRDIVTVAEESESNLEDSRLDKELSRRSLRFQSALASTPHSGQYTRRHMDLSGTIPAEGKIHSPGAPLI